MDSVTQIALGATLAAVSVPKEHRRKAALMGAALGTLPDLDVFIDYGNAVSNFTLHRGFSHSLFVLVPFSVLLWLLSKKLFEPVRQQPKAWFWAIFLPLVTHPLLDAHTAYGTQLFWPLDVTPTMWSTLFIIDPLYTLPLLVAMFMAFIIPRSRLSRKSAIFGLILSSLYLGWSWVAKLYVSSEVAYALRDTTGDPKYFSTPTPFNTLLWRVVVVEEETYLEGYYHFLHPEEIQFSRHSLNKELFYEVQDLASLQQLQWFADGFNRADVIDQQLVISDLRMGFEDNYVFRHAVAEQSENTWQEVTSELLPSQLSGEDLDEFLQMFTRSSH
jgi:inner membrane protein